MKNKLKKILNIKYENITLIVFAILFGMVLDTTIRYQLYEWQGIAMCVLTLLAIPVSYYGIKIGRRLMEEVWL